MAALALNGITIPVAQDSFRQLESRRLGGFSRGPSGQAVSTVRARKRRWGGTLVPRPSSESEAWRGLIGGLGQAASFDVDLLSNRGHSPTTTTSAAVSATAKVHGAKSLALTAPAGLLVLPFGASTWTALAHRSVAGVWSHWVMTSAGSKWVDGVVSAASSSWLAVATGSTTLDATGASGTEYVDDLALLPFAIPASWVPQAHAEHLARAWTPPPYLRATGDLIAMSADPSGARLVMGRITGVRTVGMMVGGVFDPGGEQIDFELEEAT